MTINNELMRRRISDEGIDISGLTIEQAIEELVRIRDSLDPTTTETEIEDETEYDSGSAYLRLYAFRMETPEERDERVTRALEAIEQAKAFRRRQFERLKQEFEGEAN